MSSTHLYAEDFPEEHKVNSTDVISLYHDGLFEELDAVVICKDNKGKVTAIFGHDVWNCLPFSRKKSGNTINFSEFTNSPSILRELKLLTYGWLFNKSPRKKKALSFSGTSSRQRDIKRAYRCLMAEGKGSLRALSSPRDWEQFENRLSSKGYTKNTLEAIFVAINGAINDESWHKIELGLTPIKVKREAHRISEKETQQTLVIPERLCNEIYYRALMFIETALPLAQLIADVENNLQDNYLEAKKRIDEKIEKGKTYTFMKTDGSIDNHKYSVSIHGNQPKEPASIVEPLALRLPNFHLKDGRDFRRYLGQVITSCYIICGGFSGMRDSELDKLTPRSYYKDNFNGRDHHMLQSHTFKLGEKRETWVTAASSKLAIDLMTILTYRWRSKTIYPDYKYTDSLWVNQGARSEPPKIIADWPIRLTRFCRQQNLIVTKEDYQECIESNPRSLEKIKNTVEVGKPWILSPHQFRRTLAFYCIKNRLTTLVALKQQFKHLYLSMTEWYTNGGRLARLNELKIDTKIQQMLEEVNAETTANKIFKQWHSDETLSGSHGKAIMKMRGDVPTIYSSWDVIYKAVKDGKLTLHGSMHSYCKSGYDCDMEGVVAPQFCVDCSSGSSIIDEQQAKWWQKKHSSLTAYMNSGEEISVSERSHYITQVRAAENVMRDFGMVFTPFEEELAVRGI